MYPLAEILPVVRRVRIPLSRDSIMLLLAAFNLIVLGVDTFLAHYINSAIRGYEWIPILFAPAAGILLLVAGLIAPRQRMLANIIASLIFLACMLVAGLGSYFHLYRGLLPDAPAGQGITTLLLIYTPPLFSPATFALVGFLILSAAWEETPAGSGILHLPVRRRVPRDPVAPQETSATSGLYLKMPFPKTQAYYLMTSLFILATVGSSVLDHARTHFSNPWLWLPTAVGLFAMFVCAAMGIFSRPTYRDHVTFFITMVLMILAGTLGAYFHLAQNLTSQGAFLDERFLRGAPMLAPLLFANMGLLGLIILLDPHPAQTPSYSSPAPGRAESPGRPAGRPRSNPPARESALRQRSGPGSDN